MRTNRGKGASRLADLGTVGSETPMTDDEWERLRALHAEGHSVREAFALMGVVADPVDIDYLQSRLNTIDL